MKIYTYKNGEKAYFSNNEKHIISDEEIKILYGTIDAMGYVTETFAGDYIAKKIGTRLFCEPDTTKMIEYLHAHNVTMKMREGTIKENGDHIIAEQVFENENLVTWKAYTEWGDEFTEKDMTIDELNMLVIWEDKK